MVANREAGRPLDFPPTVVYRNSQTQVVYARLFSRWYPSFHQATEKDIQLKGVILDSSAGHYHKDDAGKLIKCYHNCRSWLSNPMFWISMTCSFPFEHFIWTQIYPFKLIASLIGLG